MGCDQRAFLEFQELKCHAQGVGAATVSSKRGNSVSIHLFCSLSLLPRCPRWRPQPSVVCAPSVCVCAVCGVLLLLPLLEEQWLFIV